MWDVTIENEVGDTVAGGRIIADTKIENGVITTTLRPLHLSAIHPMRKRLTYTLVFWRGPVAIFRIKYRAADPCRAGDPVPIVFTMTRAENDTVIPIGGDA